MINRFDLSNLFISVRIFLINYRDLSRSNALDINEEVSKYFQARIREFLRQAKKCIMD